MDLMSIGVFIMGISLFVLTIFAVPALIQIKKTLKSADTCLGEMDARMRSLIDDDLKPMIRSMNNAMIEVECIVRGAKEGVEKLDYTLDALKGVGDTVSSINDIINTKVKGTLIDIVSYAVGLKSGLGFLVNQVKLFKNKEVA